MELSSIEGLRDRHEEHRGEFAPFGIETEQVEFKKSTAELDAATDSIAAILNKHGSGTLYFGVRSDGRVVGQIVTEETLRKVSQAIAQRIEPTIFPDVSTVVVNGRACVRVSFVGEDVPYASGGLYRMRVADEDRRMSTGQLGSFFKEKLLREAPWDARLSSKSMDDVSEKTLKRYIERGRAAGRISFDFDGKEDALERLGLARGGRLTNAAAVLFCPSDHFMFKCGIFATSSRTTVLDMRQEAGSLYDLLDYATMYVAKNIKWRFEFDGSPQRIEIPEVPTEAVREALINAFCHRDYTSSLAVQVDIFAERIDVFSPGRFPEAVDPKDCLSGKVAFSESRNKLLSEALFRAKDIESYGTGMPRIKEACDAAGVRVEYTNHRQGVIVSFYRPDWSRFGLKAEEEKTHDGAEDNLASDKLCGPVNGPVNGPEKLSKTESMVRDALQKDGTLTRRDLCQLLERGDGTIKRALSSLKSKGVLRRVGSDKSGHWEVL